MLGDARDLVVQPVPTRADQIQLEQEVEHDALRQYVLQGLRQRNIEVRVENGEVKGPRILTAGWALFPAGGLPIYLDHLPREFLERLPKPPTAEAAARVVRQNLDAGGDATKLFLATPQPRGRLARMPLEIARAAANESHARGKPVFAHPTDEEGVREAIAAKVDILAHSTLGAKTLWSDAFLREVRAA